MNGAESAQPFFPREKSSLCQGVAAVGFTGW